MLNFFIRSRQGTSGFSCAGRFGLLQTCLAVFVLLAVSTVLVRAQTVGQQTQVLRFGDGEILFSADEVVYDQTENMVRAMGNVEVVQGKQRVRADEILYFLDQESVVAFGNVYAITPEGERIIADSADLTQGFRTGEVSDFYMELTNEGRVAGRKATKVGETYELKRGVYSACPVCEDDPERPLLWQLRADEVKLDEETELLTYRNAYFDVFGVPVFYMPYFRQTDPRVKRKSGWVDAGIDGNNVVGAIAHASYFWDAGPERNITLTPQIYSRAGLGLRGEYERAYAQGDLAVTGQVSILPEFYTRHDDLLASKADILEGYIQAKGSFDLSDHWRLQGDSIWFSEPDYLNEFDITAGVRQSSGLELEGFYDDSYITSGVRAQQYARSGTGGGGYPTRSWAQYVWEPDAAWRESQIKIETGLDSVFRDDDLDTIRAEMQADAMLPYASPRGLEWELGLHLDLDYILSEDESVARPSDTGLRVLPYGRLQVAYPLEKHGETFSQYLTPKMALVSGLATNPYDGFYNENARATSIDVTNFDAMNRSSGSDFVDTGTRFAYGFDWMLYNGEQKLAGVSLGQTQHLYGDDAFVQAGYSNQPYEPIVGALELYPSDSINAGYEFSIDPNGKGITRQMLSAAFKLGPAASRWDYLSLQPETGDGSSVDRISVANSLALGEDWRLRQSASYDLDDSQLRNLGLGFQYLYDCLTLDFAYNYANTSSQVEHSFSFNVNLLTLGSTSVERSFVEND